MWGSNVQRARRRSENNRVQDLIKNDRKKMSVSGILFHFMVLQKIKYTKRKVAPCKSRGAGPNQTAAPVSAISLCRIEYQSFLACVLRSPTRAFQLS
jgi:hypothetical protein